MIINVIEGNALDIYEAIEFCSDFMEQKKYVDKEFVVACKEREVEYPTGLQLNSPVAMPHTLVGVKKSNLCLLKNKSTIKVKQMDDPESEIETNLIFCMAINEEEIIYVDFLSKLITMFQNEKLILDIKVANSDEIQELLKAELL